MAIEAKDPSNEVDEKAAYVTVNGVEYAIVRAETWFDQIGAENAPAPGGKALSLPLGDVIKGSGKFYRVKTFKLALNLTIRPITQRCTGRLTTLQIR